MNWNLASFQGCEFLLIVVDQNYLMSQVGKARPGHEANVSRSHNCNMHPLLRLSRKNKFDNYFISFSCGGCANHSTRPGQTSHRYVTTVTASAEATFCRPDADRPKFAEYRVPGSENSSHALAIFSRVPTSSRRKLFPFRSEPNATTVANTRMFAISNPASAHE